VFVCLYIRVCVCVRRLVRLDICCVSLLLGFKKDGAH